MNEKFNKNAKVEQLIKVVLSDGEEKGLIVKDPFKHPSVLLFCFILIPNHHILINSIHE